MFSHVPSDVPLQIRNDSSPHAQSSEQIPEQSPGRDGVTKVSSACSHECVAKSSSALPARKPLKFRILTWNLCGLSISDDDLYAFTCQLQNDLSSWDFILLQEVVNLPHHLSLMLRGGHQLFLSPMSFGGKGNGILIHERWTHLVLEYCTVSDENSWLDLNCCPGNRGKILRLHSVHLPHKGYCDDDFSLSLETLSSALRNDRYNVIGMDANAIVGANSQHYDSDLEHFHLDKKYIGPWGEGVRCSRGVCLLEWARHHGMAFANTFFFSGGDCATHVHWSTKVRSQIDFILVPAGDIQYCAYGVVNYSLACNSDHFAVCLSMSLPEKMMQPANGCAIPWHERNGRKPIGWRCTRSDTFCAEILSGIEDVENLDDFNCLIRDVACKHGESRSKTCSHVSFLDSYLAELLRLRRTAPCARVRQELSLAIFTYRKVRSASQHQATVQKMLLQNSKSGWGKRFWPRVTSRHVPVMMQCDGVMTSDRSIWCKTLTSFFANLYANPDHQDLELLLPCRDRQRSSHVTVEDLQEVIGKMKTGKTCSDDHVVAEMLQALPLDAIGKLAALIDEALEGTAPLPESWSELQAILLPKLDKPVSWSDYRPVTICPTLCKVWDAILLRKVQSCVLNSMSPWQFAFVPGKSIRSPVTIASLIGEKQREWGKDLFVMKLDISKAFDKLLHDAIISALVMHQVPPEYIHAIASGYNNLKSKFQLNKGVFSESVNVERGVRQGSPLSPFLFVMVLDLVIKRCIQTWTGKGYGIMWHKWLIQLLAFADDILLFAESALQLQKMATDLSVSLATIGLAINWKKCLWTCNREVDYSISVQGVVVSHCAASLGFPYLGSLLTLDGKSSVTLDHRIAASWRAFYARKEVWRSRASFESKVRVFRLVVESCALFGCESWHLTRKERNLLDSTMCRMLRKILNYKRRPQPDGTVETWLEWWRRSGQAAKKKYRDCGFMPWSSIYADRLWSWSRKIASLDDLDPVKRAVMYRDSEWQCERTRLGDRSQLRPSAGNPFRWDRSVHRFWTRRGYYWLGSGAQRPSDALWDQLKLTFNHYLVTSGR